MNTPVLIQGGMGVGVSNWRLAKAVSMEGQLGVVSGTMLDTVFARRLQEGDPEGALKRACEAFPLPEIADRLWNHFFIPAGKADEAPYMPVPMMGNRPGRFNIELLILANFAEVFLAKEGHDGLIGINYLEKIQVPTLPSLYGAMLAGVDYVLMGAGIPRAIPGILDDLSAGLAVSLKLDVAQEKSESGQEGEEGEGEEGEANPDPYLHFNPSDFLAQAGAVPSQPLKRPKFIAIVSSHTLATNLARKASGYVDGFVIENHQAGGHNAPPRGGISLSPKGEPIYGERDRANLAELRKLNRPFWLAGKYGSADKLQEALAEGAQGVQVGTLFAFCRESGISDDIKETVLQKALDGTLTVFTDPAASASGYPFKVLSLEGTLSQASIYEDRQRVCDLGYLRSAYTTDDRTGKPVIGFRCPGEKETDFVRKGGAHKETVERKCLCNALLATVGLAQRRADYIEPPIITAGDHALELKPFVEREGKQYSARAVVRHILQKTQLLQEST